MYDYLLWRGDLTFESSPLNEVDALILSWISYISWKNELPTMESRKGILLHDAGDLYLSSHADLSVLGRTNPNSPNVTAPQLLKAVVNCPRYRNLFLCGYVDEFDQTEGKQFAALTFLYPGTAFVAFRGTDGTLVGWRENFNLSLSQAVPSQLRAVSYLEQMPWLTGRRLILGGHSKGGNLAVYAAAKCSKSIAAQIQTVYNFDGPGVSETMMADTDYLIMVPRIQTFIPQCSMIGLLLNRRESNVVIKSNSSGIFQHNALTWEVLCTQFVRTEELEDTSQLIDHTVDEWLATLNDEQRKGFIDALFNVLEATGAQRFEEMTMDGLATAFKMLESLTDLEEEQRRMLSKAIFNLLQVSSEKLFKRVFNGAPRRNNDRARANQPS